MTANDELKAEILKVMDKALWCVMATVGSEPQPEAAIVGFSHNDQLELIVGTSNKSRKYANLEMNPHVAIAIGDDQAEVQYEGVIGEIGIDADANWLEEHLRQVPAAKTFVDDPDQVWFRITPTWLRLVVHQPEYRVEEVTFS